MPEGGRSSTPDALARSSRRAFLKGAFAASLLGAPCARAMPTAERSLRVSTPGGYFEDCLARFVYPEFQSGTGIRIESAADGTADNPADIVMVGQVDAVRGRQNGLWRSFDANRLPNVELIDRRLMDTTQGEIHAIPGMAWYQTLVVNPDEIGRVPTSWRTLWESRSQALWGLASGGGSALFEITAATWFDGNAILDTAAGVERVIAKIQELKPNVKLWWESEGTMESAYVSGDVVGGMYFHDVASLMARNGAPIKSIFPLEGAVIDFASWCQPISSTKVREAELFLDFMCRATTQAMITRKIGAPLLVDRRLTDLTDTELAATAGDHAPIAIAVDARIRSRDLMDRRFFAMLTS